MKILCCDENGVEEVRTDNWSNYSVISGHNNVFSTTGKLLDVYTLTMFILEIEFDGLKIQSDLKLNNKFSQINSDY